MDLWYIRIALPPLSHCLSFSPSRTAQNKVEAMCLDTIDSEPIRSVM